MIDVALLRNSPELVRASLVARGDDPAVVETALAADASRRDAIKEFETLRAEQNAHGKLVAAAPNEEKSALVAQAQELADRVKRADKAQSDANDEFAAIASGIGDGKWCTIHLWRS